MHFLPYHKYSIPLVPPLTAFPVYKNSTDVMLHMGPDLPKIPLYLNLSPIKGKLQKHICFSPAVIKLF
jgi:hypothetical protein